METTNTKKEEADDLLRDKHFLVLKSKIQKFLDKTKEPDVLIIKTHLICEYYLNQLLVLQGKNNNKNLNFPQKISETILDKDEFHTKTKELLIVLNKLRNRVGHELEYSLSESDVDLIGHKFGKKYIVEKYETEDQSELLRSVLQRIIINVSIVVENGVNKAKESLKE